MCFISRRLLTYRVINNINRKELYDFYYTAITLTTGYKIIRTMKDCIVEKNDRIYECDYTGLGFNNSEVLRLQFQDTLSF